MYSGAQTPFCRLLKRRFKLAHGASGCRKELFIPRQRDVQSKPVCGWSWTGVSWLNTISMFRDRFEAGLLLAEALGSCASDASLLAIPRGGIEVGHAMSVRL